MTNNKTTKRALLSSALALLLCFVMLIGTTFAWFTDEATSANNKIQAGKLDVQLFLHNAGGSTEITESSAPIFGEGAIANSDSSATLWEPGKVQTVYLSIKNNGNLDLKYQVAIVVSNITKNLNEVVDYIITPDATVAAPVDKADLDWNNANSVVSGINVATTGDTPLTTGSEHFFALSVRMDPEAGNEYMEGSITFDLKVLAAQLASEFDSYDNQYDADATYPAINGGIVEIPAPDAFPVAGLDLDIFNKNNVKVGSMNFPANALDEDATHVSGDIVETDTYTGGSITVDVGNEIRYFNISAAGLKSDNDVPVTVRVYIGEGFDPNTFTTYHYDDEIESTYNPYTGYVTFKTATFSPFAIEYDKDSTYNLPGAVIIPGENLPDGFPTATIVESHQYENVDLPWGSYGSWSPTEDLDNHLEGAFTFSCTETLEQAKNNPFAQWNCDFVVSLNQDLAANQIFLGGNYGSFGWVGFHNGDLTLEAGSEIPLLGSVTSNPWTYLDVVQNVGTFICGVGDVDDALQNATFTVMLRLTNPENSEEFYNVATVKYTFGDTLEVGSQEDLNNAFADENVNKIVLGAGEFAMPDDAKDKTIIISGGENTVLNVVDSGAAEGDIDYSLEGSDVVFNDMTIKLEGSNYPGYARINSAVYNNCTIEGANFCLYGDTVFNNCTFNITNGYVWTWGAANVEFNNCTFDAPDGSAKAILVHNTVETTVIVNNCTFKGTVARETWDHIPVAAVSIDPENGSPDATVYFVGTNTYSDAYNGLYQVKYADELDDVKVYEDGVLVDNVPVGKTN